MNLSLPSVRNISKSTRWITGAVLVGFAGVLMLVLTRADSSMVTPTNPLPFDMPSAASLRASNRKVFAHYWPPMPISIDNQDPSSDYYARNYLTPTGESGRHAAYGGLLRERPVPRAPLLNLTSEQWHVADMKTEISNATKAGLDGFMTDYIISNSASTDQNTYKNPFYMLEAADQLNSGFAIATELDMSGSMASNTPTQLASFISTIAAHKSAYRLADGRLVLVAFKAEAQAPSYWTQVFSTLKSNYGIDVAFVPCFVNAYLTTNIAGTTTTEAAGFAPISYGFSNWGSRNPAYNSPTNLAKYATDAHARGKIWVQPVSLQDVRPNQSIYDEANNTENLRDTWQGAIDNNAEWVQMTTWNDYTENTGFAPSTHKGWSPLDINAYYLSRFKLGAYPSIVRDTLYVSHRIQPAAAQPTYAETSLMKLRGGSPARDKIEVLAFLTAPGTVEVNVGGKLLTASAPAGESALLFDLAPGSISADVVRSGLQVVSVKSPFTVTTTPYVQDLDYYFVSSGREGLVRAASSAYSLGIDSPLANTTVKGVVTFSGNEVGLNNVEVWNAGKMVSRAVINGSAWTATVDTTALPNGTQTYTVYGWDTPPGTTPTHTEAHDIALNISNTSTADTTPPSVPTNLQAAAINTSTVALTWAPSTDSSGITTYRVYRNDTLAGSSSTVGYSDAGLTAATSYSYTVKAVDTAGNVSAPSAPLSVKTAAATTSSSTTKSFSGSLSKNLAANYTVTTHLSGSVTYKLAWTKGKPFTVIAYDPNGVKVSGATSSTGAISGSFVATGSTAYTFQVKYGDWPPRNYTLTVIYP